MRTSDLCEVAAGDFVILDEVSDNRLRSLSPMAAKMGDIVRNKNGAYFAVNFVEDDALYGRTLDGKSVGACITENTAWAYALVAVDRQNWDVLIAGMAEPKSDQLALF